MVREETEQSPLIIGRIDGYNQNLQCFIASSSKIAQCGLKGFCGGDVGVAEGISFFPCRCGTGQSEF